jgi:phosphatidylserine/phosphatidylglycerophosphate/cardiolipin synthase-like enzyme
VARKKSRRRSRSRKQQSNSSNLRRLLVAVVIIGALVFLARQGYIPTQTARGYMPPEIATLLLGPPESPASDERELTGTTSAPVGEGAIQAFFTTPSLVYPDVPEQRTPPPHETAIINDIDAAQHSISLAVFEYNLESLAAALIRAHERGVNVRLALDHENLEKEEMSAWAGEIERAGIPISWEESTAFLHSKFIIIDDTIVWMGSWNASENDTYRNNNNLLRFTIPALVENYNAEFEQMFNGAFGNDKNAAVIPYQVIDAEGTRIENYFSPRDPVAERLVELLNGAQSSIRFLSFAYTSDEIAQAMIDRHHAGVTVEGVFEQRNARGTGAEFDNLADNGIAVLLDGNCYTMHHKIILIDDATIITGSYNFSARAEDTNDENLVIIANNPDLAARYLAEFERVYGQAQNPTECGR